MIIHLFFDCFRNLCYNNSGDRMKKIYVVAILILASILLTGCFSKKFKTDLNKKYRSYWEYSLGSYTSSYETESDHEDGGVTQRYWRRYTFTFNDSEGRTRDFHVSNFINSNRSFNDQMQTSIGSYLYNSFKFSNVINETAINGIVENAGYRVNYGTIGCTVNRINDSIDYYDDTKGVKISSLNLSNLGINNIKLAVDISMSLYPEDGDFSKVQLGLEELLNNIVRTGDYRNIKIIFEANKAECYKDCKLWDMTITYDGVKYNWVENKK